MRDVVTIDIRKVYESLAALPDTHAGYPSKALTNDEEWILWTCWRSKGQQATSRALKRGREFLRENFKRMEAQGGPKGKRPEWVK